MPDFISTNVDSKTIDDAAISVSNNIDDLQSIIKTIESQVMPNLNLYWQGQACEAFKLKLSSLTQEIATLTAEYTLLNDLLTSAGTEYEKSNDTVLQTITKLPT